MLTSALELDCRQSLQDVRAALIELYASMEIDPTTPQRAARRFDLNKNLTWRISRLIDEQSPLTAIQHMPGAAGIDILLTSFATAGAPARLVENVRETFRAFDAVVRRHAGERADLDMILDSMGHGNGSSPLGASCELAFKGNSGIWGVQARVRSTTVVLVPGSTPGTLTMGMVAGFIGFRCLRPHVRWPLFRFRSYTDQGSFKSLAERRAFEPAPTDGSPRFLLKRFSSPALPPIESFDTPGAIDCVLSGAPVGNQGVFDCFFGQIERGMPGRRSPGDEFGEIASSVSVPVETMMVDILVHRDVHVPKPEVVFHGRPEGGPDIPEIRRPEHIIPLGGECIPLAGRAAVVATPLVPRYAELVQMVFDHLSADKPVGDFRGWRLIVHYPPMSSTVAIRWPLPD
jgi:hypothetical protein